MDPKFQSSFIPKGPVVSPAGFSTQSSRTADRGLLGFIASIVFFISIALSAGLFGYQKYLESSIAQRGDDLKQARAALNPGTIKDLSRLNSRIVSTNDILSRHTVLSPLFDFLESSTFKSVRYTGFKFSNGKDLTITMSGQARGYSAVALQADTLSRSKYIKNPVFSDLILDDKGNVLFSFKASLSPDIISYKKQIDDAKTAGTLIDNSQFVAPATTNIQPVVSTSTPVSNNTKPVATTTPKK